MNDGSNATFELTEAIMWTLDYPRSFTQFCHRQNFTDNNTVSGNPLPWFMSEISPPGHSEPTQPGRALDVAVILAIPKV